MKRVIILALALAFAPAGMAQLYKYVDKNGKTVYSDQPPLNTDSKQLNVPGSRPAAAAPAPPKSAVERDKENDKGRKDVAEKQKKADEEAARVAQNELRCQQLKDNLALYTQGGRILKNTEKGERDFMSDADIESARERTRREMEEACKK